MWHDLNANEFSYKKNLDGSNNINNSWRVINIEKQVDIDSMISEIIIN